MPEQVAIIVVATVFAATSRERLKVFSETFSTQADDAGAGCHPRGSDAISRRSTSRCFRRRSRPNQMMPEQARLPPSMLGS
mmetsp:Transcript_1903/g.7273  ORF Transcript_1903/g.7273 Transcript_1903/m.7273 type:complete len:81 (-) Transcript_1903:49-291(-)